MADQEASQNEDNSVMYIWKIPISRTYVKSIDSILKLAASVLSLIAFICCASGRTDHCDDEYASTYNFFEFVSMSAFLTLVILWFFYALTLNSKLFFKMVPWYLVDLVYLAVYTVMYFIASAVIGAQHCGKDSNRAACAFGFFTIGCMVANGFFSFRAWRGLGQRESSQDAGKSADYNAERNMEQY